jgi:hypothetical protein
MFAGDTMKEQIANALDVKTRALKARDSGDPGELKRALTLINSAADILDELWKQKGEAIDKAGADASPDERELVGALAETYGVKGGIQRSLGNSKDAVDAYDKGFEFERHQARKEENSYNLIQRLTNRVLIEPREAGAPQWKVDSKNMWEELEEARAELQRQVTTGGRGKNPWAAADVLTVHLLLAPRDPSEGRQRVKEAYTKFKELKPKPRVYESTLRALGDLKESLEGVAEDERSENLSFLVGQLGLVTEWLRDGFEEAKSR